MGRNLIYSETMKVRLHPDGKTKLQTMSDRRAIVNLIVENGGIMSIKDINTAFQFDISAKVVALLRAGWLEIY